MAIEEQLANDPTVLRTPPPKIQKVKLRGGVRWRSRSLHYLQDNFATRMPGFDHFMCFSDILKWKNRRNQWLELPILHHFCYFSEHFSNRWSSTNHLLAYTVSQGCLLRRRLNRREQYATWLQYLPRALLGFATQ